MSNRLHRLSLPYIALSLVFVACGDDGTGSATDSATPGTTSIGGTTSPTSTPTDPSDTVDPSNTTVGMSDSMNSTVDTEPTPTTSPATSDTDTGPDPSDSDSDPSTDSNTTDGVCPDASMCAGDCCAADELCDNGQCVPDCGGPAPCGSENPVCCADGELCHLGECVVPGGACMQAVCATKPLENTCEAGFVCDPSLQLCLPSKADPTCQYVPPPNVFQPEPLWTWGKRKSFNCNADADCQTGEVCTDGKCAVTWTHHEPADDDAPNHYQSSSIPVVVDLNDDCVPDVVFNTYSGTAITSNGVLRAVRGDTGEKLWTLIDPMYETDSTSNIAVGDIDMDGTPEVVACGEGKTIIAIDGDGTPLWKSQPFTLSPGSGSVAIANMDNDGAPEIVFGSAIFDNAGNKLYEGTPGVGKNGQGPISCIADLDGDGRPELIGGRTAYKTTGTVAGGDFAGAQYWNSALTDGFCGIADFDGDAAPEVVLVSDTRVYVLNGQTGATLAQANIPGQGRGGPPNIADFNGDGNRDIAVAGNSRYTVFLFDAATNMMSQLWTAPTEDDSSQVTGSSVFDFDGDGRNEVVYNDEKFVRIYPGIEPDCATDPPGPLCDGDMTDAEVLFADKNSSRTRTEYPVIADVNGDFKADIVFATNNDATPTVPAVDAGIEVFKDSLDNWVSTRPVWNQHTYHITNVGLVGEIPVNEQDNWTTPAADPYNSYRNNVQGGTDFCAPDLTLYDLDFEAGACAEELALSVFVANIGCLGVGPGVNVSFYENDIGYLGTVQTQGALVAGAAEQVFFNYPGAFDSVTVYAVVDDDGMGMGALNECDEVNNTGPMTEICVPPG